MKKGLLTTVLVVLVCSFMGCGKASVDSAMVEMSAVTREVTEEKTVWFDDEAVALVGSVVSTEMTKEEQSRAEELKSMSQAAFELVNKERVGRGLEALTWNNALESCAMVRAQEIVTTFSHNRPNGNPWYTVNSEIMWGENLARGYTNAQEVVEAWMDSPTHAENILASDFKVCSIAIYEVDGSLYFAQEFSY